MDDNISDRLCSKLPVISYHSHHGTASLRRNHLLEVFIVKCQAGHLLLPKCYLFHYRQGAILLQALPLNKADLLGVSPMPELEISGQHFRMSEPVGGDVFVELTVLQCEGGSTILDRCEEKVYIPPCMFCLGFDLLTVCR